MAKKPILLVAAEKAGILKKKPKAKKKAANKPGKKRESPFERGEKVWVKNGETMSLCNINTTHSQHRGKVWCYSVIPELKDGQIQADCRYEEDMIYPAHIFKMIATDAYRMKLMEWVEVLNNQFDGKAVVWGVFRIGRNKRPWCYYVFPDGNAQLTHRITYKNTYGYNDSSVVHNVPAKYAKVSYMPISGTPKEILSYLGVHVYGRRWMQDGGNETGT